MASSNFELVGKAEAKPEVITLADGGTVELHTFEAQIKGHQSDKQFVTGRSAAAMWAVQESQRR
jgi:hypothetical protein